MGGGGAGAGAEVEAELPLEAELSLEDGDEELDVLELEPDVPDGALEWLQPKSASKAIAASPRTVDCFRMSFTPVST